MGWALALAALWVLLTAADAGGWWVGVLAVALGVGLHVALGGRQPHPFRLLGLPRFVPWFLYQSARGGVDVARRSLSPSLPLEPDFLRYRVRLPEGPPRVFFMNCISLQPGTFCADMEEASQAETLLVHLLALPHEVPDQLARLEAEVARLFGVGLEAEA